MVPFVGVFDFLYNHSTTLPISQSHMEELTRMHKTQDCERKTMKIWLSDTIHEPIPYAIIIADKPVIRRM